MLPEGKIIMLFEKSTALYSLNHWPALRKIGAVFTVFMTELKPDKIFKKTFDLVNNTDQLKKIKLDYIIHINGLDICELSIRYPIKNNLSKTSIKHQKKTETNNNSDNEVMLFSQLCDVHPIVIESLDMKDYKKIQQIVHEHQSDNHLSDKRLPDNQPL